MRQLASYYLHNVGYKFNWFDDHFVPLCSPVRNTPVHTIIGAGNGTGKSTAISLAFSSIIPDQKKFLRSVRRSESGFRDYFDFKHYRPSFIILEFDAGPTKGTLLDYERERVIVGQVVCLSRTNDEYMYRRFFSFRAKGGLSLDFLRKGSDKIKAITELTSLKELINWFKKMRQFAPKGTIRQNLTTWITSMTGWNTSMDGG